VQSEPQEFTVRDANSTRKARRLHTRAIEHWCRASYAKGLTGARLPLQ
jgi:hypothetical protein